jgi:hypothetical protein
VKAGFLLLEQRVFKTASSNSIILHLSFQSAPPTTIINSSKSTVMADTKFSESEQDCAPEDLWTLIKQLRIYDLVIAIQQTVLDDIQRIINLARDRPFTLADFTSLNKEFFEMCEDLSIFTALTSVICTILLFYLGILAWSSLTGPAAGKTLRL